MKKRHLTDEEKRLWQLVKKSVTPLGGEDDEEEIEIAVEKPAARAAKTLPPRTTPPPAIKVANPLPLTMANYAGVDKRTADRFRKGDYKIDARLDLHGLSRDKAHTALDDFIHDHYAKNHRCLLVITGKGNPGVLREMLPRWLADTDLRAMVLAFDVARQQHGGTGAYYVLLKRKRQ